MLATRGLISGVRSFHSSLMSAVKVGDKVPSIELQETPKTKINLADLLKSKKAVVVTVPGAFTGTCNDVHVPQYINAIGDFKAKGYDVLVVTANDAFVVNAWSKALNGDKLHFLADPEAKLAKEFDLELELVPIFGQGKRFKRGALVIDHGVVKQVNLDLDGTVTKTAASFVLKQI